MTKHLLLFAATTGYQIRVFADAARRLGAELTLATDRCHVLEDPWGDRAVAVRFDRDDPLDALRDLKVDGVAAVGDAPAVTAARTAEMLGVPFHSYAGAVACRSKHTSREMFRDAGMRVPEFFLVGEGRSPRFPCVVKPLGLSGSRGVIRANNDAEYAAALARIAKMGEARVQVEDYIPGPEFAVEALMTHGRLHPLAVFDKPDPLEGPYFEETIYATPSRESPAVQDTLIQTTAQAASALGLTHGPVHAELRYNTEGAWILEVHARPIGGLCARAVRFTGGVPLEEAILVHAMGGDVSALRLEHGASGVMMIPIPKGGVYRSVGGLERASAVMGVEDVVITATPGQHLVQLPEGASYLGFIFARGETTAGVELSLRRAHAELEFEIAAALDTFSPSR